MRLVATIGENYGFDRKVLLARWSRVRARVTVAEELDIDETPTGSTLSEILERTSGAREAVIKTWLEGLKATKFYYSKSEGGMVHEPDYKARQDAADSLAAYLDGKPAQTTIVRVPSSGRDPFLAVKEAARQSPAVREALREMLDELERPALPS
jgi:hypothetical protein